MASAACAAISASPALAVGDPHAFDPVLSLTGGCGNKTSLDEVEDPGCPEENHQPGTFIAPKAVATDFYGNIYISSGKATEAGQVDIFDPDGFFIGQVLSETGAGPLAVDSKGTLYLGNGSGKVLRYAPTVYKPLAGEIEYKNPPVQIVEKDANALAINVTNDHLFAYISNHINEYDSAANENKLLDSTIGEGTLSPRDNGLAIDAAHSRIYATDATPTSIPETYIRVFDLKAPHALQQTITAAEIPPGEFSLFLSLAVDEGTGHLFVYDESNAVYEFSEEGKYLDRIKHGFQFSFEHAIGVDNGPFSPNGALNPEGGRYLFVPSHLSPPGHVFAFGPEVTPEAPEVESISFAGVTETEAELEAGIDPRHAPTSYTFEYTTLQSFEEEGFEGAQVAGEGELPAGGTAVAVSVPATGLSPDTTYRFRVVATNSEGSDEAAGEFHTYLPAEAPLECPNDPFRTSFSAALPDCRAYELVTPADTNARTPIGVGNLGVYFATREASPAGDKVSFLVEGGSIPGFEGTGSYGGDPYLASRTDEGWETAAAGPTGEESPALLPGSTSPDQGHSFWTTGSGQGTAAIEEKPTAYVRYPDGHSELVGRGAIATDPRAVGKLISENGGHIVFVSGGQVGFPAVQLEENAPPDGTKAIYDRTSDEVTHVVSLLPGDETPAAGQDATYVGVSLDGEGVAFQIGSTLYLRHHNETTYEIGSGVTFAGISDGGGRIFYVEGGDLFAFDVASNETIAFTESGDVTVVNVAADGSAAYFVSPSVLTGEENPQGAVAQFGKENLYLSEEGTLSFVATVTERDVEGEDGGIEQIEGLGLWTEAVGSQAPGRMAIDPSRTTPDGGVLLFESRANLTGYDTDGHAQVYRYDSAGSLACLSCVPTLAPASGEASLQSIAEGKALEEPFSSFAIVNNLRPDGDRAFFQSEEALVVDDTDGLLDVYEWEANGIGSCKRAGGCIYLISSGHSDRLDYLYAVSDTGDDVFFRSADLLLGADTDRTPSIYDARVNGGFPEAKEEICVGEGCRPGLTPTPPLPPPAAPAPGADDNVPPQKRKHCPKGKRKVKRAGKVRCVKKKTQKKKQHRSSSSNQGGSK